VLEQVVADLQVTAMAGQEVLSLRGILRGKMALGDAVWSLSPLAYASIRPGHRLYQG
jgi:hypothetical protein